jgi:transposase
MKCKRKTDGRGLSAEGKEALRVRVVRQVADGASPEELASTLDINPRTVYRWLAKYRDGGEEALREQPKSGRPPALNWAEMCWLAKLVREHTPLDFGFASELWTLAIIGEVISQEFGVRLSSASVGRIMRSLGFTPQRPLRRACEQDPALVAAWKEEEFPQIQEKARKNNAVVLFGDESGIRSDYHRGHTWAMEGKTPVIARPGARFSVNMLSAISAQGRMRFMVHEGTANADTFCEFLKRLDQSIEEKIYLIVDGHRIHRAKKVQALLEEMDGRITLYFLPPYSPQLNPDEWVWNQVKQRVSKQPARDKHELRQKVLSALHSLQQLPATIKAFFQDPDCSYAAQ